jgi:hypothetical protein
MHGFYHIPDRDKASFFRNCYFWLKPYGRIFIHLVDKHKYNPCRCSLNRSCSRTSRTIQPRVTTAGDFVDYRYKSDVKINDKTVILTETFVDSSTANKAEPTDSIRGFRKGYTQHPILGVYRYGSVKHERK